ncbi:hypothetical protein MGP2080_02231 [marine gamma proteobacterium HTCC2080]|nr:hypothetical protein MGP2080_02231 [marine gamma proteobacterium HTCC2080]
MARVIGGSPSDRWEKVVKRELQRQLPDDWIVVCDVSYSCREEAGYIRDGQADFVVLVPEKGLVVIEVKGSTGISVTDAGDWLLIKRDGSKQKITPPPEQATRNSHNLTSRLADLLGHKFFPGLFGWVVVYPNGKVTGALDMYHPNSVVSKRDIGSLKKVVLTTLRDRGPESLATQFSRSLAEKCGKFLVNGNFIVEPTDTELESEETAHQVESLTEQQFAALKGIFELRDVGVIGPAGSGKTLLAIWRLQAALGEGKSAIYVCFNKALAQFLKLKFPDISSSIHSVDKLFTDLTSARNNGSSDFFTHTLPERVIDQVNDYQHDLIIVDEGQDFLGERVFALRFLLKDSGRPQFLMFSDFNQSLYHDAEEMQNWPDVTFKLVHNCRNPIGINTATNTICGTDFRSMPGMAEGLPPTVSLVKTEMMALRAWSAAHELYPRGGSVILSPYALDNSCMGRADKVGHKLELTTDLTKLGEEGYVYFSTIKSFKGLEAAHVVLIEMDLPDTSRALGKEDIFVGLTRATARLDVLTSSDEAFNFYSQGSNVIT